MKIDLDLNHKGVQFTSEHNTGKGRWIQTDDGYIQVLMLATDDSSLYTEGKQWVEVLIKIKNPEELKFS